MCTYRTYFQLTGISTVVFGKYRPQNYIAWVISIVGMGILSTLKVDSPTRDWVGFQVRYTKPYAAIS